MGKIRRNQLTGFGNKKAFVGDIITVVVIAVVFIIVAVVGWKVYSGINDRIQSSDMFPAEAKAVAQVSEDKYGSTVDTAFMVAYVLLFMVVIISAWFIDTHPIFFVLGIILLMFALVGIAAVGNTTQSIVNSTTFMESNWTSEMPMIAWYVDNMFPVVVVQGIVILIVLFAKLRSNV